MRSPGTHLGWLALLALFAVGLAWGQQAEEDTEYHLDNSPERALYHRSVFAHGYIHGYMDGFHWGDFDLQTGGRGRSPEVLKPFRKASAGYQRRFGDRGSFRSGYREGFRAGYADGIGGREFRAILELRTVAADLQPAATAAKPGTWFDTGFREGYESGKMHGQLAAHQQAGYNNSPNPCASAAGGPPPEFCDAYARGYTVGYPDGYFNQQLQSELKFSARK